MKKMLRYYDREDRRYTICRDEEDWNDIERAFVATLDAYEGPEAGRNHQFVFFVVPGFGMRADYHNNEIKMYYAGDR